MGTGFEEPQEKRGPRVIAPLPRSPEAVMTRRAPRRPTVLPIRVTFEPNRGTPDGVAHADERLVPGPRRPIITTPPATASEAVGPRQPRGSRHAAGASPTPRSL